jgi:lipopolysaccharide/colanic/teichoic acid biosynthesis glycosyltransferase
MTVLLFAVSVALTMVVGWILRRTLTSQPPARTHRIAVLASAALMSLAWCVLYLGHRAALSGPLVSTGGAVVGGVLGTTVTIGFVEDNAPPSLGVRDKVLMHHLLGNLEYPAPAPFKRSLDITVAAVALLATLPLWLVIALVIWFEEPGPIFLTKNSVGRTGITFRQLKFRSMRYDAERMTGPIASYPDDPRTLRYGKHLRRWHLDQLPELVNVLTGTMSLVGPRPLRTVVVERCLEDLPSFAERHTVRPGIACIAQIEKYQMPPAERLAMDRAYIRRMCIGLDLRLLGRAVLTTVRGSRYEA